MKLVVVGFNHKTTPLLSRERWIVSPLQHPEFLKGMLQVSHVGGVVFLSTCNRIEIYAAVDDEFSIAPLTNYWKNFLNLEQVTQEEPAYCYRGERALDHLLRVASGLDSMAFGETQVLGQVKQAYAKSLELKTTNPFLNFVFQQAFRIAKNIRTETGIAKRPTSISSVALLLAEQVFGDFKTLTALAIGLGDFGCQTAELLMKRGVKDLIVTNRTHSLAENFAKRNRIKVQPFAELKTTLPFVDLVITSTSSAIPILSKKDFFNPCFQMRTNPLVLIDLGVPRNIDPAVADYANLYLYNIDDLKKIAETNLTFRKGQALLAEEIIEEAIVSFERNWGKRAMRTLTVALGF